jgi:hypothetical protein
MRTNYGLGQLSAAEKSDILDQHKSLYNGYQTMQPQVSNTQPLYVYDPAGDKDGLVVNNKGEVKKYTNFGINEQVEEKSMCEQCGGQMAEGICEQCGPNEEIEEGTGKLDDIYNEKDLNISHGDFDYVEGGGNDYGTFEGMHKNLYKEDDVIDDDGFEDIELSTDELGEQGGNVDDMDTDSVEPAYDFESEGPGGVYPVNEYDDEEVEYERMESAWADDEIKEQGWGTVARIAAPIVIDYAIDKLSNEGEIGEVDVSGSQGIYGDMDPAYDFDSDGPGIAGPYQRFSYNEDEDEEDDSFEFDFDEFDPRDKSWEEIKAHTGDDDWSEIDEDIMEDFTIQKTKISEMFNRMNRYN